MGDIAIDSSTLTSNTATMLRYHRPIPNAFANILKVGSISFAAFVAYESLAPTGAVHSVQNLDKLVHAGVYFILALLIGAAWHRSSLIFLFITVTLFGGALEIAQGSMGLGRTASLADAIANAVGAGLALIIWAGLSRLWPRKE